jgi:predicted Zn-dependent peptidase
MPVILAARPSVRWCGSPCCSTAVTSRDLGRKPGTSSVTMAMLDEGAGKYDSLQLADRAERLGAEVIASSSLDTSFAAVSHLPTSSIPSLGLLADVVRRPQFPADELERVRKEWIASIAREKDQPDALALRVLPPVLYGQAHPYGIPFTGSGTPSRFAALTRDDLLRFQREVLRPDNAIVIVTGAITSAAILPLLEKQFGDWRPEPGTAPVRPAVTDATPATAPSVYCSTGRAHGRRRSSWAS